MSPVAAVKQVVCEHYGIAPADLESDCRLPRAVGARHVAVYLAWSMSGYSRARLARAFGRRWPEYISHAVERTLAELHVNPALAAAVAALQARVAELAPAAAAAVRDCLRCGHPFHSAGPGNRICRVCKLSNAEAAPGMEGVSL